MGVYRPSSNSTDSLGDEVTPTFVGNYRGTLQLPRLGSREEGPGDRPTGVYLLFLERKTNVRNGDTLHIKTGPNAGKWLTVSSDPYQARKSAHIEIQARPYIGPPINA